MRKLHLMSIFGIRSSPFQRRIFLCLSLLTIFLFVGLVLIIYYFSPDDRGWNLLLDVLVALASTAIFMVTSTLIVKNLFHDPYELSVANKLLPQDIAQALSEIAETALEYKIFVRTGRHFRSAILPILVSTAVKLRRPVKIEIILLDFRNDRICGKYSSFRKSSSFDHFQWSRKYVQTEILATILKLIQAAHDHPSLVRFNLYLSSRLSNFRFNGSQDQIIVTREDPKDLASRYRLGDNDFSAYVNEFDWIREEAFKVKTKSGNDAPTTTLRTMFDNCPIISELESDATDAMNSRSPYIR